MLGRYNAPKSTIFNSGGALVVYVFQCVKASGFINLSWKDKIIEFSDRNLATEPVTQDDSYSGQIVDRFKCYEFITCTDTTKRVVRSIIEPKYCYLL